MKIALYVFLLLSLSIPCIASDKQVVIEVIADHSLADISSLSFKTFCIKCNYNSIYDQSEEEIVNLLKRRMAEKGLEFKEKEPDAILYVLVQDLKHRKYAEPYLIDDSHDWPNTLRGNIDSVQGDDSVDVSLDVKIYENVEEMPAGYIQLFLVMNPHRTKSSGLFWAATATSKETDIEISSLINVMIENLMLEYPQPSNLPKQRRVNIEGN